MMFCVEAAEGLSESACVLVFSFVTVFCSCIRADSASAFTRAMVSSAMLSAEFFALAVNSPSMFSVSLSLPQQPRRLPVHIFLSTTF